MELLMKTVQLALVALPMFVAACSQSQGPAANNAAESNAAAPADVTNIVEDSDSMAPVNNVTAASATAGWAGRWTGPEGLFLDVKPAKNGQAGHFALTIKDTLEAQGDYEGEAQGDAILFTRNGKTESIRPGTGPETGFKYLADKKDCLIVQEGKEGYCR
jgi:hypothetical protein